MINGVTIIRAEYNSALVSVLNAEIRLWDVCTQSDTRYAFWVNPNNDGGSSIGVWGKLASGEWGYNYIFRGKFNEVKRGIESILNEHYRWTYAEFAMLVEGWVEGRRMERQLQYRPDWETVSGPPGSKFGEAGHE